MEAKKIGCYICTGCGIGEALTLKGLTMIATKEQKIPVVKNHEFLCGPEGAAMIRQDMAEQGVNALVIAGCSPRAKTELFLRLGTPLVERVNLREQVLWSLDVPEGDSTAKEDRQMMAEDYLRMSCTKIKKMEAPQAFQDPGFSRTILVVGGGIAGLTAAKEAASAGYPVVLVEKQEQLGGLVGKMHKVSPMRAPYRDLEENPVTALTAQVSGYGNVKIYTNAAIKETRGAPGLFDVDILQNGQVTTERIGAIVLATGYTLYDPTKLGHLGYGVGPDVITGLQFEEMAKAGKIARADGQPAKKVGFVLCAGQRDANHLEYCSAACCTYTMKHALYLLEQNPDASAFVVYQEIRTPGQMEDFYRKAQDAGVVFIKGDVKKVAAGKGGSGVAVEVDDKLLRNTEALDVDLLVLATGMLPNIDTQDPNKPSPMGAAGEELKSVLNLQYRQGPSLPELKWGFPDSHYICFPYETRRTGVYAAGPVRRPMGIEATLADATGATLKAIQAVESIIRGAAVHPRAGDLSYPSFKREGCTQCKRCTEECPFGAINEDEKGNPLFNPTRCRRCSTCMGACPQKIISFANYSVEMIGAMLKSVEVPPEEDEKPRILIFTCENDAYPALDTVGYNRGTISPYVRIIPVRCLGSTNLVWIADAMSAGFDGIMLMGCRHGDDYQCHFVRGSALAEIRLSKVSETLSRLKLESSRVKMVEVNIMDADRLPKVINDFAEELSKLGANPFKGF